jgi:hypothetical protein
MLSAAIAGCSNSNNSQQLSSNPQEAARQVFGYPPPQSAFAQIAKDQAAQAASNAANKAAANKNGVAATATNN